MTLYQATLDYFRELSHIPRMSLHEEKVKTWITQWAEERGWSHETDSIGNLLVIAMGSKEEKVCLQAHLDMVCVADGKHNFAMQGITLLEKEGTISGQKTTLGADNGIGVATMMAIADIAERPTLELLFTIGEEIGLVGAQHITLPIAAPYALNLDWSDSKTIGIGCGGTLLLQGTHELKDFPCSIYEHREDMFLISLHGMQGGHSGEDIRHYRGNALIELLKSVKELKNISHIGDISGGDADNAIPHSGKMIVCYTGHPNLLKNELSHLQKVLRTKYTCETLHFTAERTDKPTSLYRREDLLPLLEEIIEVGAGVQTWGKQNTPLSSWNLGILSLKNTLSTSYFARTNLEGDIEVMKNDIMAGLPETTWTLSHESPPWICASETPLLSKIQEVFCRDNEPIPTLTTHAAVEAGLLSKKYPQTQWLSVGATIHDMHTTRESIKIRDFEEFVERMEALITRISNEATQ